MDKFTIIEQKENQLFKRKEVKFSINAKITPTYADARKMICEKFSIPEENIRIKNILGRFGSRDFIISANIYASEKDKITTEGKSKKDVAPKAEQSPEQQKTEKQDKTASELQKTEKQDNKTQTNETKDELNKENKQEIKK